MSTFLEDPRIRQRWANTLHATETATENAAAGIWSIQHNYITPCLGSVLSALESCAAPCLGDREERIARRRQQARGREYGFDFYDDWDDDDEALVGGNWGGGSATTTGGNARGGGRGWGGLLGSWGSSRGEDWDRLIGGSGAAHEGGENQQPRRKRGMSYGTATQPGTVGGGERRGSSTGRRSRKKKHAGEEQDDPTIIPSTAPLGFLGRLPFKIGGTLRYKPSAANLRDHVGAGAAHREEGERQPLLSLDGEEDDDTTYYTQNRTRVSGEPATSRKRSGTAGSGDTSDSYRSRNDLFPSDEEGDEDAVPLDDEFDIALGSVILPAPSSKSEGTSHSEGDEASSQARKQRRKGLGKMKKRGSQSSEGGAAGDISRSVSRTTIASAVSTYSFRPAGSVGPASRSASMNSLPSLPDSADAELEQQLRNEDAETAAERGIVSEPDDGEVVSEEVKDEDGQDPRDAHEIEADVVAAPRGADPEIEDGAPDTRSGESTPATRREDFVPARLPHFT